MCYRFLAIRIFSLLACLSASNSLLAAPNACPSLFSNSQPEVIITIQQNSRVQTYREGFCVSDAIEILRIMEQMPESFDMRKVKVLVLQNVVVGRVKWPSHVAVYDGLGNVYDPGIKRSKNIEPVTLKKYITAVMNKGKFRSHNPTEIRLIDPSEYLRESTPDSYLGLLYFTYGMRSNNHYLDSRINVDALPPVLTGHDLINVLNNPSSTPN